MLKAAYLQSEDWSFAAFLHKNLRAPLSHFHRVHLDKSFVLLFSIDEERKTIIIEGYAHHDDVYKR